MASSPAPIHTIDDLIDGMTSQGVERRSAYLRFIREIENGEISIITPYRSPWPPEQVLHWLLLLLQKLANCQPGDKLPLFLFPAGVPDYLGRLRFRLVEKKNSARAGAGRPPDHDWEEAEQFVFKSFKERGLPDELGQVKGWKSNSDVARAVIAHLAKLAPDQEEPDLSTVLKRVPGWIKDWRTTRN
jgi:hypothetical protein